MAEAGAGPSLPKRSLKHGRVKQPGGGGQLGVREGAPEAGVAEHAKGRRRGTGCHLWNLEEVGRLEEPCGGRGTFSAGGERPLVGTGCAPTLFLSLDLVSALPLLPFTKHLTAAGGALYPQSHWVLRVVRTVGGTDYLL